MCALCFVINYTRVKRCYLNNHRYLPFLAIEFVLWSNFELAVYRVSENPQWLSRLYIYISVFYLELYIMRKRVVKHAGYISAASEVQRKKKGAP